jgi:hypothetical protein
MVLPALPSSTYPCQGPELSRSAIPHQARAAPLALEPVEAEVVLPSFRIRRKLE